MVTSQAVAVIIAITTSLFPPDNGDDDDSDDDERQRLYDLFFTGCTHIHVYIQHLYIEMDADVSRCGFFGVNGF